MSSRQSTLLITAGRQAYEMGANLRGSKGGRGARIGQSFRPPRLIPRILAQHIIRFNGMGCVRHFARSRVK
jgi:hypothetical protein